MSTLKKDSRRCEGFELNVPIKERMLISHIQLMPAHRYGETVEPYPDFLKALWDTGAQSSTISSKLADQLGLPVIADRVMTGAGGQFKAKEYLAGLILPNDTLIPAISLYGFVGSDKFDLLIGMDIISLGDFLISTHKGIMYFSFQIPSIGGIRLQNIQKATCSDGSLVTKEQQFIRDGKKIGKNELCPCGSGKKYKKCHGKRP